MSNNLDLFGEIFINEVRDRTISLFDDRVKGNMKGESSQQLYKDVQTLNESQREIMYRIIEQVTDLPRGCPRLQAPQTAAGQDKRNFP